MKICLILYPTEDSIYYLLFITFKDVLKLSASFILLIFIYIYYTNSLWGVLKLKKAWHVFVIIFGSLLISMGYNLFLVAHGLLSGGVTSLALILNYLTSVNMLVFYLGINIPLIIVGWFMLGRRFISYSILSVVATTLFLHYIPVVTSVTDPLLAAIYAGVLTGAGSGICLKVGGSSGGFDILAAIIGRLKDVSIGNILTILNALIVFLLGYTSDDWNIALASALSLFISGRVLNFIHTEHEKVTVYIITSKPTEIIAELFKVHRRGITKLSYEGAYSCSQGVMLMTVVTRYELIEVKDAIKKIDDHSFVNVTQTLEIMGNFHKRSHVS